MDVDARRSLPSRVEWKRKSEAREELEKWSGNFTVDDMLDLYSGDPSGYFNNPKRKAESPLYQEHVLEQLKKDFRFNTLAALKRVFKKANYLYLPAFKVLRKMAEKKDEPHSVRKTRRHDVDIKVPSQPCIEFLKEKKFLELESKIEAEKKSRKAQKDSALEAARETGRLVECLCCFDECLPEDLIPCRSGHVFCRECITRGTSVAIGDGK